MDSRPRNRIRSTREDRFRCPQNSIAPPRPRRGRRLRIEPTPPRPPQRPPSGYSILVAEDWLLYRFCPSTSQDGPGSTELGQRFCAAFVNVWNRVTPADRQRLLCYWRDPEARVDTDAWIPVEMRPVIQIVPDGSMAEEDGILGQFGRIMSFPMSLVEAPTDHLTREIARSLAQVYRFESRAHYALILDALDDPLAEWERAQRSRIRPSRREQKLRALEQEYRRQYAAQMAEILGRWGFDEPHPGKDEATCG